MKNEIVIENFDEKEYLNKLAKLLEDKQKCERQVYRKIELLIEKKWGGVNSRDIFEPITGGVKILDWEWELDQSNYKKMFSITERHSLCYAMDLEDSKLLRGPLVYYYIVCNKAKKGDLKKNQINNYKKNIIGFLKECKNALKNVSGKQCGENLEKKYLLGMVDNIRNILLVLLNIEIGMKRDYRESFLLETGKENSLLPYIQYIKKCYDVFEKLLLKECNIYKVREKLMILICFTICETQNVFSNVINRENTNCFFRLHREADNMYENYVSMKYCIIEYMKKHKSKDLKTIIPCGILSGALELPIVFLNFVSKDLSEYTYINLPGDYLERHKVWKRNNKEIKDKQGEKVILFDDNVMTGSTIQYAINYINSNTLYEVEECIFLRHPEINRIYQMKSYNKAVNVEFLQDECLGYINHSPYSKIREGTNWGGEFLDEVGVFTLTGEFFLRYLFKNGLFQKESEVDYFGKKEYYQKEN